MKLFDPSPCQDQILWRQFRNGDHKAFKEIYQDYYLRLLSYGLKIKHNKEFVEECIQETFYDLWLYINKLSNTDSILFYLIASLRRKIFRKLKYDFSHRIADSPHINMELPDDSSEDTIIEKEWRLTQKRKLKILIDDQLSPRQKEALIMRFYLDLDYQDISDLMRVNIQSVRNLVHTAIKALRQRIKEIKR